MMNVLTDGELIYASHHLGTPRLRQGSGGRSDTGDAAAPEKRYGKQESVTGDRCTDNLQLGMGWLSFLAGWSRDTKASRVLRERTRRKRALICVHALLSWIPREVWGALWLGGLLGPAPLASVIVQCALVQVLSRVAFLVERHALGATGRNPPGTSPTPVQPSLTPAIWLAQASRV